MNTRRQNNSYDTDYDVRSYRASSRPSSNRQRVDYGQGGSRSGSASRRTVVSGERERYSYDRLSDDGLASGRSAGSRSSIRADRAFSGALNSGIGVGSSYSDGQILRNSIIALIGLVVCLALFFNLGSCMGRAVAGAGGASEQQANAEASSQSDAAADNADASGEGASSDQSGAASQSASSASGTAAAPVVAADEGVEDPWVDGGRFSSGDAELDQLVKNFCDGVSDSSKSAADNAFTAYFTAVTTDYVESDDNQYPTGPTWDIQYAKQMLTKNTGNCYEFVAATEYILKYFGYYDAQAEPCHVLLDSGGYGEHGLLYVTDLDGRKCLIDPSFASNGWMLDADSYTVRFVDVGQDPSEQTIANFEAVETANWIADGTVSAPTSSAADAAEDGNVTTTQA